MMVAHHPMIFNGLRHVRTDLYDGRLLQLLLSHNVAVYAAHTNLDIAQGGVNDVLAAAVGLERVEGFAVTDEASGACIGRMGYLPEKMPLADFARQVKSRLGAECVRVVQGNDRQVQKVALCSGAGADFIGKAAFKGADVYLTGDVKYHDAQKAVQQGINVIDAGKAGIAARACHDEDAGGQVHSPPRLPGWQDVHHGSRLLPADSAGR